MNIFEPRPEALAHRAHLHLEHGAVCFNVLSHAMTLQTLKARRRSDYKFGLEYRTRW
jgi:hypothetical protein